MFNMSEPCYEDQSVDPMEKKKGKKLLWQVNEIVWNLLTRKQSYQSVKKILFFVIRFSLSISIGFYFDFTKDNHLER